VLPPSWRAAGAAVLTAAVTLTMLPVDASAARYDDDTIVGADGKVYPRSPKVVSGRDDDLFDGYTFDVICADGGAGLRASFVRLSKLARIVEGSGRKVVFTVLPPKALVNTENVVRGRLPHGSCDRTGLDQQRALFDGYQDPAYLHVRKDLAAVERQVYWRTDPHWTTVGASVYTKRLASRLSPRVGALQRYKRGAEQTAVGAMTIALGDDTPETVDAVEPKTDVVVRPLPGTTPIGESTYVREHQWRSSPSRLTHPGRTLVIGDSFGYIALTNLRPIFRRGQFLWLDNTHRTMARAIAKADTVVFQVAHLFAGVSELGKKAFRTAVRKALG
jgi:alginate O-acetyltransferase complex protein AlgJ